MSDPVQPNPTPVVPSTSEDQSSNAPEPSVPPNPPSGSQPPTPPVSPNPSLENQESNPANPPSSPTPPASPEPAGWLEDDRGNKSSIRLMSVIALFSAIVFSIGTYWLILQRINLYKSNLESLNQLQEAQVKQEVSKEMLALLQEDLKNGATVSEANIGLLKKAQTALTESETSLNTLEQNKQTPSSPESIPQSPLSEELYIIWGFLVAAFAPKVIQKWAEQNTPVDLLNRNKP